jgi:hypothetical protein
MSISTKEGQQPARRGGKARPIAWLIAATVGLGGLGVAAGMALGAVGAASPSPSPASTHHNCPRGAYDGYAGYGSPKYLPDQQRPGTP